MRRASTTTSGSSATARWRAGPFRRASRSSRERSISPSTSRITRSTTPSFEGEIPKGNYGAGTVEIWDRGTYELVEEKRDGGLTVHLHGERLEGLWTLVPAKLSGDEKNWLLVKKKEDAPASKRRGYKPMLSTLASDVPRGDGWLFEVKWDGYRAIATMRGGEVELTSRNGNRLDERFPAVVRALERSLRTPDCVLDGEVVAVGADGRATFSAMQQGKEGTVYLYVAFDVLEVEGEPLVALAARRAAGAARLDRRSPPGRRSALRGLRRRRGALRGGTPAALRGDRRQARRLDLRAREGAREPGSS